MAMVTGLSGCAGGLVPSTPPDTYGLSAAPVVAGGSARNRQILISVPTALKALDSEQIVIRTSPAAIEYLAKSQWSDRLPNIVQDKLVQAFENSGAVGGVGRAGDRLQYHQRHPGFRDQGGPRRACRGRIVGEGAQ